MTLQDTRPYTPTAANGNGSNGHTNGNGHSPAGRVPPHSLDSERSLLGAMLLSRDAIFTAMETCRADTFYKPAHGYLFDAIIRLANVGEAVDVQTVADELRRDQRLDMCGGVAGLLALQADTPSTTSAGRYAKTISEAALLRALIAVAGEIAELGYTPGAEADQVIDRAETLLFDIGDQASHMGAAAQRLADAMTGWLDQLENRYTNGTAAVPTGIVDLDHNLAGGLRPGELWTFAARPAMGKTQIGIQIGYHVADQVRLPSLAVSAEMPTPDLLDRIVASQARVDLQRIRSGELVEKDWPRVSDAVAKILDVPMWIYHASEVTLAQIRAQARRAAVEARKPLGVLVVDYLQLLSTDTRSENRQIEVDTLARGLKTLALAMNVPVINLCQVNRNIEGRADKRPLLADLRESGGIEAHSDGVVALYRDEVYHPDSKDHGIAELIVLKNRNGPLGTVQTSYLAQYGIFANMAKV